MQPLDSQLVDTDFANICTTLYSLAQKHTPTSAISDVTELVQIAKILQENNVPVRLSAKMAAHSTDYSCSVVKQTPEYRLMRARFAAALGTIADMGSKKVRKSKSEFHAGINEGLRRAAKIAIMFLEDLDANIYTQHQYDETNYPDKITEPKSRSRFVR